MYILQGILHIEALIGHGGRKYITGQLTKTSMDVLILEMGVDEEMDGCRRGMLSIGLHAFIGETGKLAMQSPVIILLHTPLGGWWGGSVLADCIMG